VIRVYDEAGNVIEMHEQAAQKTKELSMLIKRDFGQNQFSSTGPEAGQEQKNGFRRRPTHGESLANETEPFSDAATLRTCAMRTDYFENYTAGPFRRTYLWVARRWLWPPGVPSRVGI
jgi:hypothetical protein